MTEFSKQYNLEDRTTRFGEIIISFCKNIRQDNISAPIINQLVRSGTSIGANYAEANSASSRKDFKNKIYICKKEAQETRYWLKMINVYSTNNEDSTDKLSKECQELILIFGKILSSLNKIKK